MFILALPLVASQSPVALLWLARQSCCLPHYYQPLLLPLPSPFASSLTFRFRRPASRITVSRDLESRERSRHTLARHSLDSQNSQCLRLAITLCVRPAQPDSFSLLPSLFKFPFLRGGLSPVVVPPIRLNHSPVVLHCAGVQSTSAGLHGSLPFIYLPEPHLHLPEGSARLPYLAFIRKRLVSQWHDCQLRRNKTAFDNRSSELTT